MKNSSQVMLDLQFLDTPRIQIQLSENCSNDYRVFGSYNPYPSIRILRLTQLEDYLNRWRQLLNLQKYPIRTILFSIEPRIFSYVNRQGHLVYAGYMYNAFKEFSRRHNATIRILDEVPKERLQITAIALFAMPHARPLARYLYFARPFTWTVWLAVAGTIGYGMLMLYSSSNGNGVSEIGKHFLSSWCHLLFIPQPVISFSNWQQVTIHFMMMLTGFILTNFYLALLSSMLTSGLFEPQFNTFEDLVRAPYPLLLENSYAETFKKAQSMPDAVKRRIIVVDVSVVDASRIALNTSYMYIGYIDRLDGILYQQRLLKVPLFKLTTQSFIDGFMSVPVVTGLPYLNMLNIYLRRIFECGILAKMKSDAWQETIEGGITKLMRGEEDELKPYDLEFYYYAYILWAVGLVLSMLCFMLERFRGHMTKQFQLYG
ncbi:uncharacterized protein LOC115770334 [Drosophila novamexicana]|uniref:uncharacterized protein LOC115770334 n=1 Tax=Drosophila novamexicana TaxID=47314 RepID=UPI0011E5A3BB|nr:uncharacterized protein LOC115770334 [Drosophila novamexicana]